MWAKEIIIGNEYRVKRPDHHHDATRVLVTNFSSRSAFALAKIVDSVNKCNIGSYQSFLPEELENAN